MVFKKILLGTVFATTMASSVGIAAELPTLSIDGSGKFQAYGVNQKRRLTQGQHFGTKGDIKFNVSGAADNGLQYAFITQLSTRQDKTNSVEESYLQFSGDFGVVQLGGTDGAEDTMFSGAWDVMGGTGGPDGDWANVFTLSSGVMYDTEMVGDTGDAVKATYYSPTINGFRVGLSYTPNSRQLGMAKMNTMANNFYGEAYDKNNLAGGVDYTATVNDVNFVLSLVGVTAKSHSGVAGLEVEDTNSWQAGTNIGYGNYKLGVGYINNGKSRVRKSYTAQGANAGEGYNIALSYTMGPATVAIGHMYTVKDITSREKAKAHVTSLTADYSVAPGLGVYADIDFINLRSTETAQSRARAESGSSVNNNHGEAVIVGTKVKW